MGHGRLANSILLLLCGASSCRLCQYGIAIASVHQSVCDNKPELVVTCAIVRVLNRAQYIACTMLVLRGPFVVHLGDAIGFRERSACGFLIACPYQEYPAT